MRPWRIFIAVLLITVALEFFVEARAHFAVERVFGFNALYGFVACAALILVAKGIGWLIKRPQDYYGDE